MRLTLQRIKRIYYGVVLFLLAVLIAMGTRAFLLLRQEAATIIGVSNIRNLGTYIILYREKTGLYPVASSVEDLMKQVDFDKSILKTPSYPNIYDVKYIANSEFGEKENLIMEWESQPQEDHGRYYVVRLVLTREGNVFRSTNEY